MRPSTIGKTLVLTAIVVVSNVAGNLFLSMGMRSSSGILSPWVFLGVALLILWTLSRMALLSWADLSFVLPVTAVGYPLSAFAGKWLLGEHISESRWTGTALILAGTLLVGLTSPAAPAPEKNR